MQVIGKLTHKLEAQTGQGKNGEWKKQTFVLEIDGNFPKFIAFDAWGDTLQWLDKAKKDDSLKVEFDLESREYQGRWFTNAKAWKIEVQGALPTQASSDVNLPPEGELPDLPF